MGKTKQPEKEFTPEKDLFVAIWGREDSPYVIKCLAQPNLSQRISIVLSQLTLRERYVLEMRFGLEGNKKNALVEIARELSLTRERIRQIQEKGLRKLRHPLRGRVLMGLPAEERQEEEIWTSQE